MTVQVSSPRVQQKKPRSDRTSIKKVVNADGIALSRHGSDQGTASDSG